MKLTKIIATEVVVHARDGYVDRPAFGPSLFDKTSKWMIELQTDSGLVGYGETPRGASLGQIQWAATQVLGKSLLEIPWGRPVPSNLTSNDMFGHLDPPVPHRPYERDFGNNGGDIGVELAVHDLLGKATGLRACDLYGGAQREWVPTCWWMGRSDPEHAARHMEIGLKLGFNSMKMKGAAEDDIVGIVKSIKNVAGDDTEVIIDPNRRFYRTCEAIDIAHQLEPFGNVILEDPMPFDIAEWQLFRQKTSIPLAMHCATEHHIALANHCCDYVTMAYPAKGFLGIAHMAACFGVLCWAGSGVELGILDAYILHFSSAARNCVLPGDAFGHRLREDDLIEEELEIKDGAIKLPDKPGLGVTLDKKAMARYAKQTWESEV